MVAEQIQAENRNEISVPIKTTSRSPRNNTFTKVDLIVPSASFGRNVMSHGLSYLVGKSKQAYCERSPTSRIIWHRPGIIRVVIRRTKW